MRYYEVRITNASTGAKVKTYTSFVGGKTDPGALNIELDVPVVPYAQPMGGAFIRVWGITEKERSQASDLNGMAISVFGGMQKGLPLANPKQAGLIVQGYILQAFGNWLNTDMTLDLILSATPTKITPPNLSFNWKSGAQLSQAIKDTLTSAYPSLKQNVQISDKLKLANDEPGFYTDLVQFAQYVKQVSASIVGGDYQGVDISIQGDTINVLDGTTEKKPRVIDFKDFIGQPTWIESPKIQFKTVMRADISVGDFVKLPEGLQTTTPQSQSQFRDKSAFKGSFFLSLVRHVGNFRQPDGASWVTIFEGAPSSFAS